MIEESNCVVCNKRIPFGYLNDNRQIPINTCGSVCLEIKIQNSYSANNNCEVRKNWEDVMQYHRNNEKKKVKVPEFAWDETSVLL